jgi:hypothetical protein
VPVTPKQAKLAARFADNTCKSGIITGNYDDASLTRASWGVIIDMWMTEKYH